MKSMVAALFLVIGPALVAQTVKPALPDIASIRPQAAQMEQIAGVRTDMYSDSSSAALAVGPIFSSSSAMSAALTRSTTLVQPPANPKFKTFSENPFNRTLIATEFWSRGLDAFSTHQGLNNPCNCYHEASRFFGLSMAPMLKTAPGAYSYSLGVAAIYTLVSAKVWNASEKYPRHGRLLRTMSRVLLIGDSSMETTADVRNFSLTYPGAAGQ